MVKTQNKRTSGVKNGFKKLRRTIKLYVRIACVVLLAVAILPLVSLAADNAVKDPAQKDPLAIVAPAQTEDGQQASSSVGAPPVTDGTTSDAAKPDQTPGVPAPEPGAPTPDAPAPETDAAAPDGADSANPAKPQADTNAAPNSTDKPQATDGAPQPDVVADAAVAEEKNALPTTSNVLGDPTGFAWEFADKDDGTREIMGYTGNPTPSDTVHVPAWDGKGKKVTSIKTDKNAFKNMTCKIDFSQATNLEYIGDGAFSGTGLRGPLDFSKCEKLTKIGDSAFQNASKIESLTLPPDIKILGSYAFTYNEGGGHNSLSGELVIPYSLENLGLYTFRSCSFTGLRFDEPPGKKSQLTTIPKLAFANNYIAGELKIPASITSIGASAFYNNRITSVDLQATDSISVSESAFKNNRITNNPLAGHTYSQIGKYAFANNNISGVVDLSGYNQSSPSVGIFSGNAGITEVTICSNWSYIPADSFKGLTNLTNITIPKHADGTNPSLKWVETSAFQDCTSLESINFNSSALMDTGGKKAIGDSAFKGCTSLQVVKLGEGVWKDMSTVDITVGNSAFQDCTSLSFIDLPPAVSGVTSIHSSVGDDAFNNTNLGAFPDPAHPEKPLGVLPLDRRDLKSIGARAFKNSNLDWVTLPSTLESVGDEAFADNHISNLELPKNSNLTSTTVGKNILANQTVKTSAYWGENKSDPANKADILLETLHAFGGLVHDRVDSVALNMPGEATPLQPLNDWKADHHATYTKSQITTMGATFTYGYEIKRTGSSAVLSHGTITLESIEKGMPYTFYYYDNPQFTGTPQEHTQWSTAAAAPQEKLNGVADFGGVKAGYHTQGGSYSPLNNAGWRTGSGPDDPAGGHPQDPSASGVAGTAGSFFNRWIGNSYSVKFDNNWNYMVKENAALGTTDAAGTLIPNSQWVSPGKMSDQTGFVYGDTTKKLPKNVFTMGGYKFAGWATSPDLDVAERQEGSNFFKDENALGAPEPAPVDGGTLTLYAQWDAINYGESTPELAGFLSIPQGIVLKPYGDKLYSQPKADAAPDDHAIVLKSATEAPGATWPQDKYQISVVRASASANLIDISTTDGTGQVKQIDVYDSNGAIYNPGANDQDNPGAIPTPLIIIDPHGSGTTSGTFFLESTDSARTFLPNADYSGTMTFRIDIVPK